MKAVLYARVSSAEQAEGHSLDAQVRILEDYAARHGIEIMCKFAVPESASGTKSRKTYAEMLTFVKQHKIAAILFEKIDRSTRNLKETVVLDDWISADSTHQVHYVKENLVLHVNSKSHDRFKRDLFVILARQYIGNLSEEVKKGQAESVKQGLYPGGGKYGYLAAAKHGERAMGKARRPDPVEAPKIRKVFQKIARGVPTAEVWQWAREEAKVKNNIGGSLSRTCFYRMIRDPFYCGQFVWAGKLYDHGQHEPIVSRKLFYQVQDILNGRSHPKQREQSYLFQSLVRDERTQRALSVSTNRGHAYYRLRGGSGSYITEYAIDCKLGEYLASFVVTDQLKEKFGEAMREFLQSAHEEQAAERQTAVLQLNKLDQQLASAEVQLFDGVITRDRYEFHKQRIESDKAKLYEKMPTDDKRKTDTIIKTVEDFVELIKILKTSYLKLPKPAKAQLAKILLSNIHVNDGNIYIQGKKPVETLSNLPINPVWLGVRDVASLPGCVVRGRDRARTTRRLTILAGRPPICFAREFSPPTTSHEEPPHFVGRTFMAEQVGLTPTYSMRF